MTRTTHDLWKTCWSRSLQIPMHISTATPHLLVQGNVQTTGCCQDTRHQATDFEFKNIRVECRSMTNTFDQQVRVAGGNPLVGLLLAAATRVRPSGCVGATCRTVRPPDSYTTRPKPTTSAAQHSTGERSVILTPWPGGHTSGCQWTPTLNWCSSEEAVGGPMTRQMSRRTASLSANNL